MQVYRNKYSVKFYEECNEYLQNGHSLKECSEKFDINYTTLRTNLIKLGFRTPNRVGKINKTVSFNEHYFDNIDTHNKAYFLGLLMSDGYICKTAYSYSVGIALQSSDLYILEKLKEEVEGTTKISEYKNSYKYVMNGSKHMFDTLKSYGIEEDKSHTDYIVPNISKEYLSSFIRGYFDGDGCITIKSTGYSVTSICCNSEMFLNSLKSVLSDTFLIPNIRVMCEQGKRKNPLYVLYLTTKENQNMFKNLIYQNSEIKLIRKFEKFEKIPC